MGTVPLLETDSGEYLPESNAILTFLAEGTLYLPREGMPRARVIRWLMFEQRYIQTSISRLRYWTLTAKLDQFSRDVATARVLGNRALDVLDQHTNAKRKSRPTAKETRTRIPGRRAPGLPQLCHCPDWNRTPLAPFIYRDGQEAGRGE